MIGCPRFVVPDFKPFDPVDLARETEEIVCKGNMRKYNAFYATGVYGGIATGYTVGCCLRCIYCWVDLSRDFPEEYGKFYYPEEVVSNLQKAAKRYGTHKCRISGGEPTLCRDHLLNVLKFTEKNEWFNLFILETNGILFGSDKGYVEELLPFKKVHVRVSLKAGTGEGFQRRTGAIREYYELPFKAIRNLYETGISFHVAAMTDLRIMREEERREIISKLNETDEGIARNLEEEVIDSYGTTLFRLKQAGVKLKWH